MRVVDASRKGTQARTGRFRKRKCWAASITRQEFTLSCKVPHRLAPSPKSTRQTRPGVQPRTNRIEHPHGQRTDPVGKFAEDVLATTILHVLLNAQRLAEQWMPEAVNRYRLRGCAVCTPCDWRGENASGRSAGGSAIQASFGANLMTAHDLVTDLARADRESGAAGMQEATSIAFRARRRFFRCGPIDGKRPAGSGHCHEVPSPRGRMRKKMKFCVGEFESSHTIDVAILSRKRQ
jgi:hypothetical protein